MIYYVVDKTGRVLKEFDDQKDADLWVAEQPMPNIYEVIRENE